MYSKPRGPYPLLHDEWELMGERCELPAEVKAELVARQNAIGTPAPRTIGLAPFVQGVRQV